MRRSECLHGNAIFCKLLHVIHNDNIITSFYSSLYWIKLSANRMPICEIARTGLDPQREKEKQIKNVFFVILSRSFVPSNALASLVFISLGKCHSSAERFQLC